jgi:hypothetical protein
VYWHSSTDRGGIGRQGPRLRAIAFALRSHRKVEFAGNSDGLGRDGPEQGDRRFDLFLSHVAEDKDAIARPLKEALSEHGWSVWFDEAEITLGDSLQRKLDEGLHEARFGVVILSPHFFEKPWPQVELDALAQREVVDGRKVILPVWHEVDESDVVKQAPTLAGKYAARSAAGVQAVVSEIERAIGRPDKPEPSREGERPHALPPGSNNGKQKAAQQPRTFKRPRMPKWVGALVGIVLTAYLTVFFTDHQGLVRFFESGYNHSKGNTSGVLPPDPASFSGTIVQPSGAWQYKEARLGVKTQHHAFDTPVSIVGYCIGQPTRNSTGAFDERWLLLAGGGVIPRPEVHVAVGSRIPLKGCPGSHGTIGGPMAIRLGVQPERRQVLLRATSGDATTVGFAAVDRGERRWTALGIELDQGHDFVAHASSGTAVAIAVACWAPQVPATPTSTTIKPVYALKPLGQKPELAYEYAIETIEGGTRAACSPTTYGSRASVRKTPKRHTPSPEGTSTTAVIPTPIEAYKKPSRVKLEHGTKAKTPGKTEEEASEE